jgi:isoleucyl-tRNA synthetase
MYYLDMAKGRLYTYAANSSHRRAAQTAIYSVLEALVSMIAPVLSFTAEDAWQHMPKERKHKDLKSVHLLSWPKAQTTFKGDDLEIIGLIPEVARLLEEKRSSGEVGSSFDAEIILLTNDENRYKYVESLKDDLPEIFKVSQVILEKNSDLKTGQVSSIRFQDIALTVKKASGAKCVRCWNYSASVGKDNVHPLVCDRCLKAIGGK